MTFPLAGVLGFPVKHSKSPLIHNSWIKELNLKGLYVPLAVAPEDFPSFIHMAPRLGFVGFNVTIPHKEAALKLCTAVTETARRAGSVNTIVFAESGEPIGDSTDGYGFLENLKDRSPWSAEGSTVAMFGAGGAARAVAAALIDAGVKELRVANRSPERAEELKNLVGGGCLTVDWSSATDADGVKDFLSQADLVINATSLGMSGGPDWRWNLPALDKSVIATDLIYAPLITPFLAAAAEKEATIVDGLGMLLHQAAPGFERWFGAKPKVTESLRELVLSGEGALP